MSKQNRYLPYDRGVVPGRHRPVRYLALLRSFEAVAHSSITVKYFCTLLVPMMKGFSSPISRFTATSRAAA